jgi:hypothetical protein
MGCRIPGSPTRLGGTGYAWKKMKQAAWEEFSDPSRQGG